MSTMLVYGRSSENLVDYYREEDEGTGGAGMSVASKHRYYIGPAIIELFFILLSSASKCCCNLYRLVPIHSTQPGPLPSTVSVIRALCK
jgi:hypothetical protein